MKIIHITQGKTTTVDNCDYEYLKQWKWQLHNAGYAIRSALKADNLPRGCKILMHRVILERAGFKGFATGDHKDRNRLNNRRTNLRPATKAQNACNTRKLKAGASGAAGVVKSHPEGRWCTGIKIEGVYHHLGTFDTVEEASAVYQAAKAKRDALTVSL